MEGHKKDNIHRNKSNPVFRAVKTRFLGPMAALLVHFEF